MRIAAPIRDLDAHDDLASDRRRQLHVVRRTEAPVEPPRLLRRLFQLSPTSLV
jgi:hypothetical protein